MATVSQLIYMKQTRRQQSHVISHPIRLDSISKPYGIVIGIIRDPFGVLQMWNDLDVTDVATER